MSATSALALEMIGGREDSLAGDLENGYGMDYHVFT